ncbi:MAG: porphobilinogen synthase [Spirochaetes bacterium]|nr:porphobilinogen synthase [Spirochaetota bacterium]
MNNIHRPRRLRNNQMIRDLSAEVCPDKTRLIMPHFVVEEKNVRQAIKPMPGIFRVCTDNLLKDLESDLKLGIDKVILFGIPAEKDEMAKGAYDEHGVIQKAIRRIKKELPDICVIADVCLCEYMSHGHCGIVENGKILNDPTLELLGKTAVSYAAAGADIVAPSDMMDHRVGFIREALDVNEFTDTIILSYAAKYASAFYDPFRDAAGSAPGFGDRKTYQMDYRNAMEAEKEVMIDIEEGADMVMVKPALAYMDIIRRVRKIVDVPLCTYNVSGEYAMVKASVNAGVADEKKIVTEIMTSLFRAGANMIISYHTRDIFQNNWF